MNFPPPGDAKAVLAMMQGSLTPDMVMAMQRQQATSAPAAAGGGGQQQQQRGGGGSSASKPKVHAFSAAAARVPSALFES